MDHDFFGKHSWRHETCNIIYSEEAYNTITSLYNSRRIPCEVLDLSVRPASLPLSQVQCNTISINVLGVKSDGFDH